MPRLVWLTLAISVSSASFSTRAEPSAEVCRQVPSAVVFEAQGAPFDGILVHPKCLAAKALDLKVCRIDRALLIETRRRENERMGKMVASGLAREMALGDELAEARAWYRSPLLWGAVGVAVGAASTAAVAIWVSQ